MANRPYLRAQSFGNYSSLWPRRVKTQEPPPKPKPAPKVAQEALDFVLRAIEKQPGITAKELREQVGAALCELLREKKLRREASHMEHLPAKFYLGTKATL